MLRGRAEPMSSGLHAVHRAKRSGQGGIVLITGEAGIGKTVVLDAVRAEAASAGFMVGASKADEVDHVSQGAPVLLALGSGRSVRPAVRRTLHHPFMRETSGRLIIDAGFRTGARAKPDAAGRAPW
ncbi:ATP-binding protein [Streptomyces sp. NPDC086549]|uniref:ATP-binding protein n=1 Tax=Streptomyces sp. NPDC086549 TaxID=3365752 RepID=UPI003822D260